MGYVNCAYLGFYSCDSFTGFDLFAHVVIVLVNQHCYSWHLYYRADIVGLFTSQVICLFLFYFHLIVFI